MLDITISNARRLRRLSENILDATRVESKSLKLKKERFNLNDAITDTLDEMITNGELRNEKNIKIMYQPQDILVEADKCKIIQIISNILNNAVKFTREEDGGTGTISITAERKEENDQRAAVVVAVKDTGY